MENFGDDSDNDMDRIMGNDNEFGDVSAKEDEAIEDNTHNNESGEEGSAPPAPKPVKVKKLVLNPQPKLNFDTVQGPKGLLALNDLFKNHKFRGNGYEKEDMGELLDKLGQWTYRLFPKFHFEDSLKRLETLGKKREVQVYLRKIRNGMLDNDVVHQMDDDDELSEPAPAASAAATAADSFDDLLSQQIAHTQATPRPTLTDEQLARIERNRKLAMERRLQKIATQSQLSHTSSEASPMELDNTGNEEIAIAGE